MKFRRLCLEGTTASKRRLLTGYEVPGITGRQVAAWKAVPCLKVRCIFPGMYVQKADCLSRRGFLCVFLPTELLRDPGRTLAQPG